MRAYLMDNVQKLIEENYIEWAIWEEMICRIDNAVDGTPVVMYLMPSNGEVKGRKV